METFNGYGFTNHDMRKQMKYVIIEAGDLDINNAYAFKSELALKDYLGTGDEGGPQHVLAVFKVEDITKELK